MEYSEFTCDLPSLSDTAKDLLTAFLAEIGFESFCESDNKFKAYIQTDLLDTQTITNVITNNKQFLGEISYSLSQIPSQNWNATWEADFQAVEVCNEIIVRSPNYKPTQQFDYEILIEPRMAFGSGSHETTSLIMQAMLTIPFAGKSVADCGCGTGILSILAEKLGAKSVFAFDYDQCSVENTKANATLNNCSHIEVLHAKLDALSDKQFNVVLANINRNILIENMHFFAESVQQNGLLILSGFYTEDVDFIKQSAENHGFTFNTMQSKNNWTITIFSRK